MRWSYRDPLLLWLMVAAFVVHVAEEWFGGFPAWVARTAGSPMPGDAFSIINGVVLLLMIVAVRAAIRSADHGWMAVAVATIAVVNTLAHVAGAIITRGYAPGLISAVILYVPLGILTLIRAWDQAPTHILKGLIVGVALHAAVFPIAYAVTR